VKQGDGGGALADSLWMLDVMFKDDTNSWELFSDGRYILRQQKDVYNPQSSQEIFTLEAKEKEIALQEEDNSGVKSDSKTINPLKRFFAYIFPR